MPEVSNGKLTEALGVSKQLLDILFSHVLLGFNETLSIWRGSKLSKKVCLDWMIKESILRFPAVVVHAVSKDAKVQILFLFDVHQEQVFLVVTMCIHKCYHALNDLGFLALIQHVIVHEIGTKHLINISAHSHFYLRP
jgi:hypothetical protein